MFGLGMRATPSERITVRTADEHPHVQRHQRQLAELRDKLSAAQARHSRLVAERDDLRRQQRQNEVAGLLGDACAGSAAVVDRLAHIGEEIASADGSVVAARDAIQILTVIADGVRTSVQADLAKEATAAAKATAIQMRPLVAEVAALNTQLIALLRRGDGHNIGVFPLVEPMLAEWLRQVHVLEG